MSLAVALAAAGALGALAGALDAARARRALALARAGAAGARADGARREAESARLRAAVDALPLACVLFTDEGRITVANAAARALFFEGRDVEGQNFLAMLASAPEALRRALAGEGDGLLAAEGESGTERFLVTRAALEVGGERCALLTARDLTRELAREEAAAWKRAIRVMSHEVNNSLAPISSLMHTAKTLARGAEHEAKLARVFDTVIERAGHLGGFLEGYATLAKLGAPRRAPVAWAVLLKRVATLFPGVHVAPAPAGDALVDDAQLEQALINLVKNALEAGGPVDAVEVAVSPGDGGFRLTVSDRGHGVSAEVAANALLPFYTTKATGSGLGLALCREVIDGHGGWIRLDPREGGGATVTAWLPASGASTARPESRSVRLTLTHG